MSAAVVRIDNDESVAQPAGESASGPFAELLRLQTEFQARLAEETLRYLRRLQGALGPSVPGTVVLADPSVRLDARGAPGGSIELRLEIENRQRMHCLVTPALSPLIDGSGATWFPAAEASPPGLLLAPGEVSSLAVNVHVPTAVPLGTYRGALVLQGFRDRGLPVSIHITRPTSGQATRRGRRRTRSV